MKSAKQRAREMTDQQLHDMDRALRKEIPAAQSLHDAIKRERQARYKRRLKEAA